MFAQPPLPRCRGARVEAVRAFDSERATPPDSQIPPTPPPKVIRALGPTEPREFEDVQESNGGEGMADLASQKVGTGISRSRF